MDEIRLLIRNKRNHCSQSRHEACLIVFCLFATSPYLGEGVKMEDFKVSGDMIRSTDPL